MQRAKYYLSFYTGSSDGDDPRYTKLAHDVGQLCAENGIGVVYGAGSVGCMGALAIGAISHGGVVRGVIPEHLLCKEKPFDWLVPGYNLIVTKDMTERRSWFRKLSVAAVVLPGGMGTLTEAFEDWTQEQVGQNPNPTIVLNEFGFWDTLFPLVDHIRKTRFVRKGLDFRMFVAATLDNLLPTVEAALADSPNIVLPFVRSVSTR